MLSDRRLNQLCIEDFHYRAGRHTYVLLGVPPLFWRVPDSDVARAISGRNTAYLEYGRG